MKKILPGLGLMVSLVLSQQSFGLTFKTGEVIGPDGKSYVGMSPQNKANLLASSSAGVITSGFMNKHFYVVANGQVTTVPLTDLRDKTSAQRMTLIKQSVVSQSLTNTLLTNQAIDDLETHSNDTGQDAISNTRLSSMENSVEQNLDPGVDAQLDNDLEDHLDNDSFENHLDNELEDHLDNDSFEAQVNHAVEGIDDRDDDDHEDDDDHKDHDSNDDNDDD
jgi:TATA-binding protein-associated factor Taf7